MIIFKLITLLVCSWLTSSRLISHENKIVKTTSKGNNIVNLDLIDQSTLDIHYQTQCEECKCFVDLAPSTSKQISEKTFQNKIIDSSICLNGNLILIHQSATNEDFYYSIYEINSSELKEIAKEVPIDLWKGGQYIKSSSSIFEAHNSESLIMTFFNVESGRLESESSPFNRTDDSKIYDLAFVNRTLFLAKGSLGLELIVPINNNSIVSQYLSIEDLELKNGSSITNLSVRKVNNYWILYAWSENVSNHSFFLALEVRGPNEISIIENYQKEGVTIVKVARFGNEIHVINQIGERYFYNQFSTAIRKVGLDFHKVWEVPFKVNGISVENGQLFIGGDDYLYIFKSNPHYEIKTPELSLEIVQIPSGSRAFYPLMEYERNHFVSVGGDNIKLFAINKKQNQLSLTCGSFVPNYQGQFIFDISIYKRSCPELRGHEENDICLDRYTYDITFTGNRYEPLKPRSYIPIPIDKSNWESSIDFIINDEAHKPRENRDSENQGNNHEKEDPNKDKSPEKNTTIYHPVDPTPRHEKNHFDIRMKYVFIVSGFIVIAIFACLLKCFCGESKEYDEFEDDDHPHIQHQPLNETDHSEIENDQEEAERAEEVVEVGEVEEGGQGEGEEYEEEHGDQNEQEEEEKQNLSDNEAPYENDV